MGQEDQTSPTNPMLYDPIPDGNGVPSKRNQFIATAIIALGAVSAGTALAWTSPVLKQIEIVENKNLTSDLLITPEAGSWVGSCLAIGALIGALPSAIAANAIGRKYTTILLAVPFIISWALLIFAQNAEMLYAGRIFAGIGTGGYCVVCPMYISELADISIRGTLGTCFQLFLTIGILLVYLVGYICSSFRVLSAVCAIMPVLLIIFVFFIPESPTYLMKKGRRNDATVSLKWFWGQQSNTRNALQAIQDDLDAVSGNVSALDIIKNPTNRMALIVSLSLMFFQQMSGINAIIFYMEKIFDKAGSTIEPAIATIIIGVIQVLMTFVSAVLIDKAGRKLLLLQSSIVMGLCVSVVGIYFHMLDKEIDVSNIGWLPLLSLILFIVSFSLGFGPIPWMMMGELFAPDVKGVASSIAVMFNWGLVFMITKLYEPLAKAYGTDITFWVFGIFMLLCTVFVIFKVPETKGKSNAEIQLMLSVATERKRPVRQKYIPMNVEL